MNVVGSIAVALNRILKKWRERRQLKRELLLISARGNTHLLDDIGMTRDEAQAIIRKMR